MSTLRNLLVNNPRVKELQMRKTLGEAFPYTDWTKVPVKHYSKFLSLKDLIGECGVVWTNAFGRSNIEAEDTRKYLKDYSGNERDIELFNFVWTDESGYKNGAIVGDGVDDYGQCIKDFSLPDDYTVVAMRETLTNVGTLIGKNESRGNPAKPGAFCFEIGQPDGVSLESYYETSTGVGKTTLTSMPKLFSYQTKFSYNGQELSVGEGTDIDTDKLNIFRSGENTTYFKSAALYSFGIFNRTLTAEELALVEDCMYLELEYNTTILDNIEYYDILDARYRSNEEAEDKRNKWNGRLGKLHLTLNNYAYSQMSGWNGGALVSDGVDDYAISDETIDEEIGGIVVMAEKVSNPTTDYGYVFSSTQGLGTLEGSQIAGLVSKLHDNFILGDPWTLIVKNIHNIYTLSRSPKNPNNKLMINNSVSNELGNAALYQLRLIKNQPTDLQIEVIKHQVLMEHNDYVKEMGWN